MRLVSIASGADTRWGALEDGGIRLAPAAWGPIEPNLADVQATCARIADVPLDASLLSSRRLAPVPNPPQLIGIGLNYRDHAIESGLPIPTAPIAFAFFTTSIIASGEPIVVPPGSTKVDWEAELGVVIGREGRNIPVESAMEHVAGYVVLNDVSEREIQSAEGQWGRAKSFDTFKPMGPWLVTRDEVPEPSNLAIELRVNGAVKQSSSTRELVFGVAELVSRLSASTTLRSGTVISTGTPPGVGQSRTPPEFLRAGDEVSVTIERVGTIVNPVVSVRG